MNLKTGIHTLEIKTEHALCMTELDELQEGIAQEAPRRYRVNMGKLSPELEYATVRDTETAFEKLCEKLQSTYGSGQIILSRADYRIDDHEGTYADHLPVMELLTRLVSFILKKEDRYIKITNGMDKVTSLRCMPSPKDNYASFGIEYYDKANEAGTTRYGNARLELRRLRIDGGGTIRSAVKDWSDILIGCTKKAYRSFLNAHVNSLLMAVPPNTPHLLNALRKLFIAKEEEGIAMKILNADRHNYRCQNLPSWSALEETVNTVQLILRSE